MVTLHPAGFTHGPHPKALKNMLTQSKPATDEVAVMIDARDALEITDAARAVEWNGYVDSWRPPAEQAGSGERSGPAAHAEGVK
jgi:homogentisate 1,2-dioxygenase